MELSWSPDLRNWSYVAHGTPFLPRGPPKSYDCCQVFGAKQQPIIDGNTIKLYYVGGNGPFMGARSAGFSLATLQRDWWFGYAAAGTTAQITTVPVMVTSSKMMISADARRGTVHVGVVGSATLSVDKCISVEGNVTDGEVVWEDGADLTPFVGSRVAIQFVVSPGAVIFAFTFGLPTQEVFAV